MPLVRGPGAFQIAFHGAGHKTLVSQQFSMGTRLPDLALVEHDNLAGFPDR